MPTASDISIKLDGVDITDKVLFAQTHFTAQANPIQGAFRVTVKDLDQTFAPVIGQKVTCHIDGVPMTGGYLLNIDRELFFPVVDTTTPSTVPRKWVLSGPDFNVLFDKRVLRDVPNFAEALQVPSGKRTITKAFTYMMQNFIDVPSGLDFLSEVDSITTNYGTEADGSSYVGQGKTWREQMEDFADSGAVVYYIDADFKVHMHEYELTRVTWAFTDAAPDGVNTIGFREGRYAEDFQRLVTEALIWGGSSLARNGQVEDPEGIGVVFAKYPQAPANDAVWHGKPQPAYREQNALDRRDLYGRWQMAEMRVSQDNYLTKGSVKNRAFVIINGPPGDPPNDGIPGGYGRPLKQMTATWFGHDVPGGAHLRPGYLHDFVLHTQAENPPTPLIFSLPLRSMKITFPTLPSDNPSGDAKTYVRFDGQFGSSFSDSRHLWRAMRRQEIAARREIVVAVDNYSESVPTGAVGTYFPIQSPDGARQYFDFPVTFWTDTTELYLNGIYQQANVNFTWTTGSQIYFITPPEAAVSILAVGQVSE